MHSLIFQSKSGFSTFRLHYDQHCHLDAEGDPDCSVVDLVHANTIDLPKIRADTSVQLKAVYIMFHKKRGPMFYYFLESLKFKYISLAFSSFASELYDLGQELCV